MMRAYELMVIIDGDIDDPKAQSWVKTVTDGITPAPRGVPPPRGRAPAAPRLPPSATRSAACPRPRPSVVA